MQNDERTACLSEFGIDAGQRLKDEIDPPILLHGKGVQNVGIEDEGNMHAPGLVDGRGQRCVIVQTQVTA